MPVDSDNAVESGIEDGFKLAVFGLGSLERALRGGGFGGGWPIGQDQGQRRRSVPGRGEHAALDRKRGAISCQDRERLRGAGFGERAGAWRHEQRIETACGLDGCEVLVAAPFEEMTVGKQKRIVPVHQNAEWYTVEQHVFVRRRGGGRRGWRFGRFGFAFGGRRRLERRPQPRR